MDLFPILLQSDNFTPPHRTPWGGRKILNKYKQLANISESKSEYFVIGESWELSVEPDFPSLTHDGTPLKDLLSANPMEMLGTEYKLGRQATALLVKILDAAENLSVQIHPKNDYQGLDKKETGKTECWYIIDHEPGAGIYLGFESQVNKARVGEALESRVDLSPLLHFIPVNRGDLIVIEPGTLHALCKGVTLMEPQYVTPGCRGITYRYWDWNRFYDSSGKVQSQGGNPRPLHIEHALAVTDWSRADGQLLQRDNYKAFGPVSTSGSAVIEPLCGPELHSGLRCDCLQAARISGNGNIVLPDWNYLRALTVLEGELKIDREGHRLSLTTGQTVALPASLQRLTAQLHNTHAFICSVYEPSQKSREGSR